MERCEELKNAQSLEDTALDEVIGGIHATQVSDISTLEYGKLEDLGFANDGSGIINNFEQNGGGICLGHPEMENKYWIS